MAATHKQLARKKTSPKLQSQLVFSTSPQKYRQHLIEYALEKKRLQQQEQTVIITQKTGLIFSKSSSPFDHIAAQLKHTLPAKRRGSKKRQSQFSVNAILFAFALPIISFFTICGAFIRNLIHILFQPFQKIIRTIYRWNRKKSWGFRRKITQSVQKPLPVSENPAVSFFKLLVRPFYYTIRLFPLHTFMALFLSVSILALTWGTNEFIFKDLPDPHDLTRLTPPISTKILDRNGTLLFTLYEDENRTIVPLSKISPYLIDATISIEDKDFYSHKGFSIRGISRAFISNSQGGSTQGGSTITQQLVKQRLLSPEQTVRRKMREILLAILAEGIYSKEQILEMYLNQVPYGGSTYGIEEASRRYFGKSAQDLDLAESALIAGLPAAPSAYTPFGSNPEFSKARQKEVLTRMVEDGYVTQEQADQAASEDLKFAANTIDIKAPHFVMYVKDLLEKEYGEQILYQGGLEIRTTLDLKLQDDVQKKVTDEVQKLGPLHITNGAALITNPKTGEVYAMIGSKDYFDFAHDGQVNVTIRPRQPGSSIKPLTYALALEKGMTVTSKIEDEPITFAGLPGSKPYSPKNYDGRFHGNVTLKEALANSYNIPAVKMLNFVGINTMIDKAQEVGISTWGDRKRFGLSLTLGGGEVLMTDMAKLYGSFANEGYTTDLNPILEIHNYKGETLYQNSCALDGIGCPRKKVFDNKVAYLITNILSDNAARTPAFGPMSTLFIPNQEVAVKTGTTNNMRDNWTFGYTPNRLVSVWVGNNDNTPMSYVASGITGASSIWNKIMVALLDDKHPNVFPIPQGLVKVGGGCTSTSITDSGDSKNTAQDSKKNTTCPNCPTNKVEYYIAGTEPKNICNVAQNTVAPPGVSDQNPTLQIKANNRKNNALFIEQIP